MGRDCSSAGKSRFSSSMYKDLGLKPHYQTGGQRQRKKLEGKVIQAKNFFSVLFLKCFWDGISVLTERA